MNNIIGAAIGATGVVIGAVATKWYSSKRSHKSILKKLKYGFQDTACLIACCQLSLPDNVDLNHPTTLEQLAERAGIDDINSLFRFCRMLDMLGVFQLEMRDKVEDCLISHTSLSKSLRKDAKNSLRPTILYLVTHFNAFSKVGESIKDGLSGTRLFYGEDIWSVLANDTYTQQAFNDAMMCFTSQFCEAFKKNDRVMSLFRNKKIVDLGGGTGTFLAEILRVCKESTGTLLELDTVADQAKEHIESSYEKDIVKRISFRVGSFFEQGGIPEGNIYVLKNILHDWNDKACIVILSNIKDAMLKYNNKDAKLIILDRIIKREQTSEEAIRADMNMLIVCENGKERTLNEMKYLLNQSGFKIDNIYSIDQVASSCIEASLQF